MVYIVAQHIEQLINIVAMSFGALHVITMVSVHDDRLSHPLKMSSLFMVALPFVVFQIMYESIKHAFFSGFCAPSSFPLVLLPTIAFVAISTEAMLIDCAFEYWIKPKIESSKSRISYSTGVNLFFFTTTAIQICLIVAFNVAFYGYVYS